MNWLKDHRRSVALLIICSLPILLYVPFLQEPLQRDEGFYATIGRLLLHGGLPYRDGFDNKPPVVFGWYALSFLIFGTHVWAPRLLVSLLLFVTTLLVYVESKLLFNARVGLGAALAFALSVGLAKLGTNANTEYFLVLPMIAGLVAFTSGRIRRDPRLYLLSGLLNGVAILTKETALFPFAYLVFFEWMSPSAPEKRRLNTVLLIAGAAVAGLLALLPLVTAGAFGDFWDAAVIYTVEYAGDTSLLSRLLETLLAPIAFAVVAGPWVILSVFAALRAGRSSDPYRYRLVLGWTLASAAGIAFVGRFYAHYYVQLLPGLSLLVPLGILFIKDRWRQSRAVRTTSTLLLLGSSILALVFVVAIYGRSSLDSRHTAKYPGDVLAEWETESPALADYIRTNTTKDDLIYNLGFQPELYFYAERESPTRFLFDRPFATDQSFVDQALRDLQARPPKYIIDSARYDPWEPGRYDSSAVRAFIDQRYAYVGKILYADVYLLK